MADTKRNILITVPVATSARNSSPNSSQTPTTTSSFPPPTPPDYSPKLSSTSTPNVTIEEGSIQNPTWIEHLLRTHNIATVFLCLPGTDELLTTLNFFSAMQHAGTVRYLLYLCACGDMASPEGVARVMRLCSAEHVLVKCAVEQKLRYADFPWQTTVLGPTLFFSNDLRCRTQMLEQGLFDEPIGEQRVSRVATEDIALAVVNLIAAFPRYVGRKVQIGSLRTYTGAETAALWSEAIGREVRMSVVGDEFERGPTEKIGGNVAWGAGFEVDV